MELKDYYAIMGVKPTDDLKTIKTAYRRLARKYHPDVSKETDAEARFKEVAIKATAPKISTISSPPFLASVRTSRASALPAAGTTSK